MQPLLPFDARTARDAHPSTGVLLKAETPEAVSQQSEDVLVLASTMAPAEAQKFLVLVRLEQHMRIQNNTTMADGYANLIFKILDTQFFGASGSGPSAGSSGGSTGMGASSMIVGAASLASLSCDATMQAPKQPAQFKLSASEAAASVANNDADKPSTSGRGRPSAQTGGGQQSRPSTPHHKTTGRCCKGAQCPILARGRKCQWQHTPEELAAAKAALTEVAGTAGGFAESGFMAVATPLTAASDKLQAVSRQARFVDSATNIGTTLPQQPSAATLAAPKRTARRSTTGNYQPRLTDPHSRAKLRNLFKHFNKFAMPMFLQWRAAGAAARRALVIRGINFPASMVRLWESAKLYGMKVPAKVRWAYQISNKPVTWPVRLRDPAEPVPRCNDGIQCKTLRATGKCALFHSPAEVSCARQVPTCRTSSVLCCVGQIFAGSSSASFGCREHCGGSCSY